MAGDRADAGGRTLAEEPADGRAVPGDTGGMDTPGPGRAASAPPARGRALNAVQVRRGGSRSGSPPRSVWTRLRGLKLRTRIALAATLAVAIGIGAGVLFAFLAVRTELLGGVDNQLKHQVTLVQQVVKRGGPGLRTNGALPPGTLPGSGGSGSPRSTPTPTPSASASPGSGASARGTGTVTGVGASSGHAAAGTFQRPRRYFGDSLAYLQVLNARGGTSRPADQTAALPVDAVDRDVAAGTRGEVFRTLTFDGGTVRMVTAPLGNGLAVQVALPLGSEESQLDHIGLELLGAGLVGILLAAGLGWAVTRTALRPVGQLTETVERITATRDLAHRIDAGPRADRDEIGRLAVNFNAMLDAVQDSTDRQRQLVADASHELRTPLTSLRTNIEVLRKVELLDPQDREKLIASVLAGIDDLTGLVADTVELARGEEPAAAVERLRWDAVAERVLDRARAHWPGVEFAARIEPVEVRGVSDRLQRAMANLLDNAAKFAGGKGRIEVGLTEAGFTVRDHGPGIPEPDLPHVFDRFYRAASMRDRPGSGLGLAIVAQVAESHGGSVTAANHPAGGAVFTLSLPTLPPD